MQKEQQSWVFLHSGEAYYAKELTLQKAPLSPNRVETKETEKAESSELKRNGA